MQELFFLFLREKQDFFFFFFLRRVFVLQVAAGSSGPRTDQLVRATRVTEELSRPSVISTKTSKVRLTMSDYQYLMAFHFFLYSNLHKLNIVQCS